MFERVKSHGGLAAGGAQVLSLKDEAVALLRADARAAPADRSAALREDALLRVLARRRARRRGRHDEAVPAVAAALPRRKGLGSTAASWITLASLANPPYEKLGGEMARRSREARLSGLQRRARYVGDPALADRAVPMRGGRVHGRRGTGGGALRPAREGARHRRGRLHRARRARGVRARLRLSRRSRAPRSTRAATCSAPRSRGR